MPSKPEIIDFTMGADPEFVCSDKSGTLVRSSNMVSVDGPLGCDGNNTTFEVRPQPDVNPLQVVHNIRSILVEKCLEDKSFFNLNWYAGSYQLEYPLGGHIHFGVSSKKIDFTDTCYKLSQYVGLVSLLVEDRMQGERRRAGEEYGKFIDFREQTHGLEYRTMASWLTSPYIAAACLCLGKTVMFEILNNKSFKAGNYADNRNFIYMETLPLLQNFPDAWRDITKMMLYQTYKPYLDLLYNLVSTKKTWFPKNTMNETWGMIDGSRLFSQKMKLEAVWAKYKNSTKNSVIA